MFTMKNNKPIAIGRGGAILLDDQEAYKSLISMRYDGRDLNTKPWQDQKVFNVGYHYKPTIEEAIRGLELLKQLRIDKPIPKKVQYPDLRQITITE